ncbi:MAG: hypothetical protein E6I85_13235 [Chloroflexi bacterium]|nr:MAG: hypothetical protein E6I85_13235 [Chloroflexota bacterium]
MRRLLAMTLAAVVALVACGASGGDSDLQTVASAVREVESKGASFQMTETLTETGGDVPKGKMAQIKFTANGQTRDDRVVLILQLTNGSGQSGGAYDVVINDSELYVRPHGSSRAFFLGAAAVANTFYPGVRLNLLRESALLATKVTKTTNYSNGSFSDQYAVTPSGDQLEQLQSMVVTAAKEGHRPGHRPQVRLHVFSDLHQAGQGSDPEGARGRDRRPADGPVLDGSHPAQPGLRDKA